jgi:predicted DsbA family dithiol-disulfide isomerase
MLEDPIRPKLFFDFVDPLSFLLEREVNRIEGATGIRVERIGIEINPPPHPLGMSDDPLWAPRWAEAARIAASSGWTGAPARVVPWTRKAHELVRHAGESGHADAVRGAIFRAFIEEGRDIGRVDVLVDLAGAIGLDPSTAKAVLDVDRHGQEVTADRAEAIRSGIRFVPTLVTGDRRLEGFRNRARLSTFLGGSPGSDRRP